MSFSIEIRRVDHIVIMEVCGRVSALEPSLRQFALHLIELGDRHFVINLANVAYLDRFGLGQLCWIYTVARNRGGDMKLLKPTRRIKELLRVTMLDTVFESFDCEADAIASMFPQINPFSMTANGY
jgi:anti-sigma B factor antagonist